MQQASNTAAVVAIFDNAAQDRALVRFEYVDPAFAPAQPRCIIPEAPVKRAPAGYYVVGYDPARGDYRSFRLDRMIVKTVARVVLPESSCAARGVRCHRVICAETGATLSYPDRDTAARATRVALQGLVGS